MKPARGIENSLDAPEEILLDANVLAAGHEYYRIGAIDISMDTVWMAYCEDTVGRRQFTLRFKNGLPASLVRRR